MVYDNTVCIMCGRRHPLSVRCDEVSEPCVTCRRPVKVTEQFEIKDVKTGEVHRPFCEACFAKHLNVAARRTDARRLFR